MNLMSQEEILYCDRQNGSKGKECKCVCHQENYPLPKNFSNPIEPQGSWEVEFENEFVKDNGSEIEPSFKDPNGDVGPIKDFIRKVRTEAIKEERRRIEKLIKHEMSFDTGKDQFSKGARRAQENILSKMCISKENECGGNNK